MTVHPDVEVGLRAPHGLFDAGAAALASFAAAADSSGIDRLWVGDHVSFRGGQGYDGLLNAAVLAALTSRVTVQTAVYLLPLRHPLLVARQVASIAQLAPGRLVLGVGVGGDDPLEVSNCGVDPATRGRRTDESLGLVRRLLGGEQVDHDGEHFRLRGASIRPSPSQPVPVVVGGRGAAAWRRGGRVGDGWLGVFVDPDRLRRGIAATEAEAEASGRLELRWEHGLVAWCGFGPSPEAARPVLAATMESLYQLPFERFARYCPHGTPADVASALAPYVEAGARTVLIAGVGPDGDELLESAVEVRRLLRGSAA